MAEHLHDDPRVRAAQRLLEQSREDDGKQVEPARWWGRLETALTGVLAAISEIPPF